MGELDGTGSTSAVLMGPAAEEETSESDENGTPTAEKSGRDETSKDEKSPHFRPTGNGRRGGEKTGQMRLETPRLGVPAPSGAYQSEVSERNV